MVQIKKLEWKASSGGKWLRAKGPGRTYEVEAKSKIRDELQDRAQADVEAVIRSWIIEGDDDVPAGRDALEKEQGDG
ncbi:hypothetical protein MUO32_26240 [Shinella sp. CPCC 101442]|uniref:hypothetical protein n=1 Tax=Shinella sp. CPCC 101442 TaxID=2932265 RepID=UPI0021537920|nr:hypothetical protein [Shinella sp. CPCC 101442]MCR6502531.1 hypothetical protein [Shinella sp. CPCC 101442]